MLQQALKQSKKPIKIDKRTKAWKQKVQAEKLQTEKESKEYEKKRASRNQS